MEENKECDKGNCCGKCEKSEPKELTPNEKKERDEFISYIKPNMEKVFTLYTGIVEVIQQYETNNTELVILLKWLCDYEDYIKFSRRINEVMPQYVKELIEQYLESAMNSPTKHDTSPIKGNFLG